MTWTEKAIRIIEESGRSHEEIERSAGFVPGTLERAIADPEAPRADLAIRLAAALGTDAAWLFDDAREWNGRPRLMPQVTVHDISAMPPANDVQKWRLVDWEPAIAALVAGKAISVKVNAAELSLARTVMYQRLGRVETRYDGMTQRLWVCPRGALVDHLMSLDRAEKSSKEDKAAGSAAGTLD